MPKNDEHLRHTEIEKNTLRRTNNKNNTLKRTTIKHNTLRRTDSEITHSHICAKMPTVGLEPATSTYAAQTIAQLTKWADDARNEIAHSHICANNATRGDRTRNLDICGPYHYATYKICRRCQNDEHLPAQKSVTFLKPNGSMFWRTPENRK